jgi:hypothetical protein
VDRQARHDHVELTVLERQRCQVAGAQLHAIRNTFRLGVSLRCLDGIA